MKTSLYRLLFEDASKSDFSDKELEVAADKLEKAFNKGVPSFVGDLEDLIKDEKVKDVIELGGDRLKYNQVDVLVSELRPMQTEIGFDQSVRNLLTDQYNSLKSMLRKGAKANVGGPIVTFNEKWIIDGHHRWSQVFVANPSAKLAALDITSSDLTPAEVLKSIHLTIAGGLGAVPAADPKGINILGAPPTLEFVKEQIEEHLTDKAKALWLDALKGKPDQIVENLAKYLHKNLEKLSEMKPGKGAPGRKHMPQTDSGKTKNTYDVLKAAASGELNVIPSFDEPIEESAKIIERWNRLAGILLN